MGPKLTIFLINLALFLTLIVIGYGILFGISVEFPKQFGDFCNSAIECSQEDHYVCSENKCRCPAGMYYVRTCVRQLGVLSACSFKDKNECGYGLSCFFDSNGLSKCQCSPERYWNAEKNHCELRIGFDQSGCTNSTQCQTNTNLVCKMSKCTCEYPYYWNGTYCNLKSSYLQICTIELGCDETKQLNCSKKGDLVYRCECDYTRFWSKRDNKCITKYLNGTNCNMTEECRTDLGLKCGLVSGFKHCKCDSNFYWDGNQCLIKKNNQEDCSALVPCNDIQGLVCDTDKCTCPENYFHDGTRCEPNLKIGLNCDSDYKCDTNLNLSCDLALKQCVCPSTHFWNYTTCVPKLLNGSSCVHNIQCDTSKLLSCNLKSKQCLCSSNGYWNSSAFICESKKNFGIQCSETYECQDNLDLVCSTNCLCPADYYWNNTKCSPQLHYYASCSSSGHEPCLQSKGLNCTDSKCRCSDSQKYWNSVECVPKILYGENCIYQRYTDENYQCAFLNVQLVCLATPFVANSWSCRCKTTQYYDSAAHQCINRKTFRQPCNESSECQDYLGLICYQNKTCLCPANQYWNNQCQEKLAYNETCNSSSDSANESCQDYAFIFCISSVCGCDSTRYYDTEYSACCKNLVPRSSHNQVCDNDDQCMDSAPYPLICFNKTCQCNDFEHGPSSGDPQIHWSANSKNCIRCPAGYSTGWGLNVYKSPNRITNRCYLIYKSDSKSFQSAQDICNNNQANLTTIRNIMELNLIKTQFEANGFNFVLGSKRTASSDFTWNFDENKPVQKTFFCLNQPDNAGSNQNVLILRDGKCFDDLEDTNSYGYICEKG